MTAGCEQQHAANGSVPDWLRQLADVAHTMDVPEALVPPVTGGRPSAVLVLFGDGPNGPDLLFILRSADMRLHAGQPAFPGGSVDDGDEDPAATALREAAEEVGLDPAGVEVIGALPEVYVWRSGFRVFPVLAWWREPHAVAPVDAAEVAAVERISVAELAEPVHPGHAALPRRADRPGVPGQEHAHLGLHRCAGGPAARAWRLGEALGPHRRRGHAAPR